MPRKELLLAGFRHTRRVLAGVKARRAFAALSKPTHNGAVLPAKAGAAPAATAKTGNTSQQLKQPRGGRGDAQPSFAASGAGPAPTAASPGALFGGSLLKAAAAALRPSERQAPSFAASPVWGTGPAVPAVKAASAHEAQAAAKAGAAAASASAARKAVQSTPLYRWARLGADAASPAAQAAEKPALKAGQALKRYSELGGGTAAPRAAKPPALGRTAALLRYAKLK